MGAALVAEIERIATELGLASRQLESSVTAEPFYAALGYRVEERGERPIAPGVRMAAIKWGSNSAETASSALAIRVLRVPVVYS